MSFGKKYISEDTNELGRGSKINGRRYNNPYFDNKPKPNYRQRLKFILIFAFLSLILAVFLSIPFFDIKNVNIQNQGRIQSSEILEVINSQKRKGVLGMFFQENIFLFKSDGLRNKLLTNYNFQTIKVQKLFPNKLNVVIAQRNPAYIISQNNENFLIDRNGFVITKKITSADEQVFAKIFCQNMTDDNVTQFSEQSLHLELISNITAELKNKSELATEKISIGKDADTIEIDTKDGPKIYFSASHEMTQQIKKLITVKDELKENFFKKEYIDLRIDENVYIK